MTAVRAWLSARPARDNPDPPMPPPIRLRGARRVDTMLQKAMEQDPTSRRLLAALHAAERTALRAVEAAGFLNFEGADELERGLALLVRAARLAPKDPEQQGLMREALELQPVLEQAAMASLAVRNLSELPKGDPGSSMAWALVHGMGGLLVAFGWTSYWESDLQRTERACEVAAMVLERLGMSQQQGGHTEGQARIAEAVRRALEAPDGDLD